MSRDWRDPRFPDKPATPFQIAVVVLVIVGSYAGMILALINGVRSIFG